MIDYPQLFILGIEECWYMPPCDKINLIYPRSKFLDSPEPIREQTPITVTVGGVALIRFCRRILVLFGFPFRVVAVDPRDNKVNFHGFTPYLSRFLFALSNQKRAEFISSKNNEGFNNGDKSKNTDYPNKTRVVQHRIKNKLVCTHYD